MDYAPSGFDNWLNDNGPLEVRNGRMTEATDIAWVDKYATWMAVYKRVQPSVMGRPFYSGHTWRFQIKVPQFTPYMTFAVLASGSGSVAVTADGAAVTANIDVDLFLTSPSLDPSEWVWLPELHELTNQDSPQDIDWSFAITDTGGSNDLFVHAVRVVLIRPSSSSALP